MAGSYKHIVDKDNNFRGVELLDHLGDAFEALEECHAMIKYLANNDKQKIFEAYKEGYLRNVNPEAADKYKIETYFND